MQPSGAEAKPRRGRGGADGGQKQVSSHRQPSANFTNRVGPAPTAPLAPQQCSQGNGGGGGKTQSRARAPRPKHREGREQARSGCAESPASTLSARISAAIVRRARAKHHTMQLNFLRSAIDPSSYDAVSGGSSPALPPPPSTPPPVMCRLRSATPQQARILRAGVCGRFLWDRFPRFPSCKSGRSPWTTKQGQKRDQGGIESGPCTRANVGAAGSPPRPHWFMTLSTRLARRRRSPKGSPFPVPGRPLHAQCSARLLRASAAEGEQRSSSLQASFGSTMGQRFLDRALRARWSCQPRNTTIDDLSIHPLG